ncbi:MAG: methionine--tRNA ligase [Patescibacteria group bacterium]
MTKPFYITTTLPYVNAKPHIGFAMEIIQADAMARMHKLLGYDVVFNTGTDEHGQKIYEKAVEEGKTPQEYCDEYAAKFNILKEALNLSYTNFIRTTDEHHVKAAQEFWKRCAKKGDIYKKNYKMKYCVGCELEKTDSELVNGRCPLHPTKDMEIVEEENYFFKFSAYQEPLLKYYDENPTFVQPGFRFNEIISFVEKGLEDFSISRLKKKMPWGVDVPNDPEHVMYVWFDALINYISTVGWPVDEDQFEKFWPGLQTAGKDNLRQQSAMWQAMLMSADLPNSKQIFIHGFINSGGQKMSKSLGNVVDPLDEVKRYGTDAVRFYLLKEIPPLDDGDYSENRMKEVYDSSLANELGNLVSRITTLAEKDELQVSHTTMEFHELFSRESIALVQEYQFNKVLEQIWDKIKFSNKQTNDFEPWKKTKEERNDFLNTSVKELHSIGHMLLPFIPETAQKIIDSTQGKIKKAVQLFPKNK